jgi:hypothetical protein
MAKAKLIYDLTDHDDRLDFLRASKSIDMALAIWGFIYNTRKRVEHEISEKNMNSYDTLDFIMDDFSRRLDEYGINIDDLIE